MLRVMLADDNKFALMHFKALVNWEKLGLQLVGTAIDGIEAWEKFCTLSPDILITDVQMPGMNGCELARLVKERAPDTSIIFLSSYDEFDYARSAIDLSVRDYILKQELDCETFEKKLLEIKRTHESQKQRDDKVVIGQLTACFRSADEELEPEYFPDLMNGSYYFLIIEQDHLPEELISRSGYRTEECDYHKLLPEILHAFPEICYLLRFKRYRWLCICRNDTDAEKLVGELKNFIKRIMPETVSFFVFQKNLTLWECRMEYSRYQYLFEQRFFEGTGAVLHTDMYEPPGTFNNIDLMPFQKAISERDKGDVCQLIDQIFRPILYHYDFASFQSALSGFMKILETYVQEHSLEINLYDDEMYVLLSAKRIIRWLKKKTEEILEASDEKNGGCSEVITRTVRYIRKEYSNPLLSVEEIALEAGLSVNRLNDLFKKEKQDTIGRYLTRIRMEKAGELLAQSSKRIPEIVEQSGYSSASYFSRVFRKTYGMTPQEYRKRKKKTEGGSK